MSFSSSDYFILGILVTGFFSYFSYRFYDKYQRKKRSKRGLRGEKRAKALLKREGYHILKEQLEKEIDLFVNAKVHKCKVKADFYVKKGFKKYIVEVKTGKNAKASIPEIRRQMLEYDLVFKPDGMLFIDMKKEEIETVVFDKKIRRYTLLKKLMLFSFGLGLGFFLGLILITGN